MKKIKIGVIGVGQLGSRHAEIYKNLPQAELVTICDINPKRAKEISSKLKVDYCLNYKKISDDIEALSIVVPTKYHYLIAKYFLDKGKHLLVEKPITDSLSCASEMLKLASSNNCILQVGHVERFNQAYQEALKLIKNPLFIETHRLVPFPNRNLDTGVVLDLMIHDIDIIILGSRHCIIIIQIYSFYQFPPLCTNITFPCHLSLPSI